MERCHFFQLDAAGIPATFFPFGKTITNTQPYNKTL